MGSGCFSQTFVEFFNLFCFFSIFLEGEIFRFFFYLRFFSFFLVPHIRAGTLCGNTLAGLKFWKKGNEQKRKKSSSEPGNASNVNSSALQEGKHGRDLED